jgi:hypothetical protein
MYYTQIADSSKSQNWSQWEAAKIVLKTVIPFYQKANIPMISERKACECMKLLEENAKLGAISIEPRSSASPLKKVNEIDEKLEKTFHLWPANAPKQIKNREDLAFLHSMMGDCCASFGAEDKLLSNKKRREQRL